MTGRLNGVTATAFYNASNVILFAHAFTGWTPLLTAADRLGAVGDRFQAAQLCTDKTLTAHIEAWRAHIDQPSWEKP